MIQNFTHKWLGTQDVTLKDMMCRGNKSNHFDLDCSFLRLVSITDFDTYSCLYCNRLIKTTGQ